MVLVRVMKFILFLLGVLLSNRLGGRYFFGNGSCLMSFRIILDVTIKMCIKVDKGMPSKLYCTTTNNVNQFKRLNMS